MKLKILGIHGLGDHRDSTWKHDWKSAVERSFLEENIELEFKFVSYDDIFEQVDISNEELGKAVWNLIRSGFSTMFRRRKGVFDWVPKRVKWTAGYVVAWLEDDKFQQKTRRLVIDSVGEYLPDIVLAHSLGSLVTYDALSHSDSQKIREALKRVSYLTFGSQIGNPFVIGNLTQGRIVPLTVAKWYHLYNFEDNMFTAPIRLPGCENFEQINTHFDIKGYADHAAVEYLSHRATIEEVWKPIAQRTLYPSSFNSSSPRTSPIRHKHMLRRPDSKHRALLIGINDYPNEISPLEGCVNDVFLVSSVLQECGFPPGSIRTCLDRRATADAIMERLEWLLDDPQPNDRLVFYFSGHGARIPEYGEFSEPDREIEALVPWDFNWSETTAITDDHIFHLYSQLPYHTQLTMIFDCCHSGGIHRDGGSRIRGLNPPDDIRHRMLKWDLETDMWVPREFQRINERFSEDGELNAKYFGIRGSLTRVGRASALRFQDMSSYNAEKMSSNGNPVGPFLPLIIEACQEEEFSYEYRHGVTSYGAFTYAMCANLRRDGVITFNELVKRTGNQLKELGYSQHPQILGPQAIVNATVPWNE